VVNIDKDTLRLVIVHVDVNINWVPSFVGYIFHHDVYGSELRSFTNNIILFVLSVGDRPWFR
jgi:hypothetical protein